MKSLLYLASTKLDVTPLPRVQNDVFVTILQVIIATTAALSLVFIAIGGFRYIMSQGDPGAVSKSKATIVYALVGLAIAILAQAIVSFIIRRVS